MPTTDATAIGPSIDTRLPSIDAFRGLTILTMIFVNELGHQRNIPAWMRHYPAAGDGMTFVDVVFPSFLFIMGMAIPFAVAGRRARGDTGSRILLHILTRTVALLVMGVFMVNMPGIDASATGLSRPAWSLLAYLGLMLIWNDYPRPRASSKILFVLLRLAGVGLLIWLAWIYRHQGEQGLVGMRTQWWGILGLIGWAYCGAATLYLVFGGRPVPLVVSLALCIGLYIGNDSGALAFLGPVHEYINIGAHIGGHSAVALAGLLTALVLRDSTLANRPARRIVQILLLIAALIVGGFLLRHAYGINKNQATPTWCLYSAAAAAVVFTVVHVIMDLGRFTRWASFLKPAGRSPLLAYILHPIFNSTLNLLGITWLQSHLNSGGAGIVRSAALALLLIALTGMFDRLHIRLRV